MPRDEADLILCDCGDIAHWQDEVLVDPWLTRMADHCHWCHEIHVKRGEDGPDDGPDGFRGTEAQGFASDQQASARRVK